MPFAVIFDLDGTLVDNAAFHKQAWGEFCKKHRIDFSDEIFDTVFFGKTNHQVMSVLFGKDLSREETEKLSKEKEIIYREIYKTEIKPVPGLIHFLEELENSNIKAAVATSAPPYNVDFDLNGLNLKKYFQLVVDDTMVIHGKPNPEIYLKAAEQLNRKSSECVVFEDSLAGTKAAFDAGCTVIALTTTLKTSQH